MTSTDLPSGWTRATIADLIGPDGLFTDGDWVESKDQDPEGDVRLIQLADVGDGEYTSKSSRFLTSQKARQLRCTYLRGGDILIARMPDPLGRACIFPGDPKPAVTVVDVCIVRPGPAGVDHRWLTLTLNSPQFRAAVASNQSGSTRKRIARSRLAGISLPVPPLPEQRRIAAALDEHLSELDTALGGLVRTQRNLERYRSAMLATAIRGQLTDSRSPWRTATVAALGDIVTGTTPPTSDLANYGSAVPFFKPTDLAGGYNVRTAREHLSHKGARHARLLPAGSVLVTCIGATIGKCGLARVGGATNQQINAIIPDRSKVLPEFLFWYFVSPVGQASIRAAASATTLPILNKTKFAALPVALPALSVQRAIVDELERRLAVADHTGVDVSRQVTRAAGLRRSLLSEAFQGKLVRQVPSEEPAAMLLERLRAGRTTSGTTMPKGSRAQRTA